MFQLLVPLSLDEMRTEAAHIRIGSCSRVSEGKVTVSKVKQHDTVQGETCTVLLTGNYMSFLTFNRTF